MANGSEQRSEERLAAALKVSADGGMGITRDISVSGLYFETDADYGAGNEIDFAVELDSAVGKMTLRCRGLIVRTEARGSRMGVAVRMTDSVLEMRN